MNLNNEVSIPIHNLPPRAYKLQDIFHIERTFIHRTFEKDNDNIIQFLDTIKKERIFVIANEIQIKSNLPKNCKVFRKLSKEEKNKLNNKQYITYDDLMTYSESTNSIQPDCIINYDRSYYSCEHNIEYIYCVFANNTIIQYQKTNNIEYNIIYFVITTDELCKINLVEFKNIREIDFNDILPNEQVYQYDELKSLPKYSMDSNLYSSKLSYDDIKIKNEYSIPQIIIDKYVDLQSNISKSPAVSMMNNPIRSSIGSPVENRTRANSLTEPTSELRPRSPPMSSARSPARSPPRSAPTSPTRPQPNTNELDKYQPITYKELNEKLSDTYNFQESIQSTTIDIISVYLKGQKLLYIEAKVYCEQYLYSLMLPAIFITAICSILSLILRDYSYGSIVVSSLTAVNSFILTLVTYLKLDAKAEAHKTTAYSFEKLQSLCEFSSGRLLFIDKNISPSQLVEKIATQVKDIKDKNQFILPEYIRYKFPVLYTTNVFAEVKRIQINEIRLMNKLKVLINDGKLLQQKLQDENKLHSPELDNNYTKQNEAFDNIIEYRTRYIDIDRDFKREIKEYIDYKRNKCNCFSWLKT